MKNYALAFLFVILIALFSFFLMVRYTEEHTYLAVADHSSSRIAKLVWRRTMPMDFIDVDLVVEEFYGPVIMKKRLVSGLDGLGDVYTEFLALRFFEDSIVLETKPNHYAGPSSFKLPDTKHSSTFKSMKTRD